MPTDEPIDDSELADDDEVSPDVGLAFTPRQIVGGFILLAALIVLLRRRRRTDDSADESTDA